MVAVWNLVPGSFIRLQVLPNAQMVVHLDAIHVSC